MATSSNVSQTPQPGQPGGQTATPGNSGTSPTSDDYKPTGNRYFGALVLLAAIIPLPFLAALITIIVYLSPSSFQWLGASAMVIILGLIMTLVLWLLFAIPCRSFATAKGGRPSDFASLQRTAGVLKEQLGIVKSERATQDAEYKAAIADIESNRKSYDDMLNGNGLPWVSYTGYVSMWDRINKIDEAMIGVLPSQTVIESANYDELSLTGSDVPGSNDLLTLLDKAIATLSSDPTSPSAATNLQDSQQSEQEARANIRKVKSALHKFTNERWDGLVRARNQLMGTAVITAFFTYILVIIAILAHVPRMNTLNAMVFYFLGAIVGLFGRLFDERNADKVVDDYGLSTTRIIVTPLISGLAALVGVLFVTTSLTIDTIDKISLLNLIIAAVLGFAPNILISTLQSKSEVIKGQIKSASPADQAKESISALTLSKRIEEFPIYSLAEARQWSRLSLALAIIGILLVLAGVGAIFAGYTAIGLVVAGTSAIPEVIAILSLRQSRRSYATANETSEDMFRTAKINRALSLGDDSLLRDYLFQTIGNPPSTGSRSHASSTGPSQSAPSSTSYEPGDAP